MGTDVAAFYNDLAEHYHLIFEDWPRAIARQAAVLGPLLEERAGPGQLRILDCACGIGTQAIGLAERGHKVVACDLSEAAVRRAEREALKRSLAMEFHVCDMRNLSSLAEKDFDAVVVGDNSLPHLLSGEEMQQAVRSIAECLKPGGILLATIRDYDALLQTRPPSQPPAFYGDNGQRRIVHQVWDWHGQEYDVHLYLTWGAGSQWTTKHFASRYRAVRRDELSSILSESGFEELEWLMPDSTSFYQPVVIARKP
jgi:glycine/sarcosine N-methyltransferase